MIGKEYPKQKSSLFFILTIMTLLLFSQVANAKEMESLKTIFHIYIDDEYIGVVSDDHVVDEALEQIITNVDEKYQDQQLTITNEITYVPEQVFRSIADNEAVIQKLKELAIVESEATAIFIEGKPIAFLKDENDANDVLKQLKLQYVSEKDLATFESSEQDTEKTEHDILDIQIDEEITLQEETIAPDKVWATEKVIKFIQKGTLEERIHTVEEGDVLGSIAKKYGLSTKELLALNEGLKKDSLLQIGQELQTVVTKPLVHVVVEKEKVEEKTVPYEKEYVEDSSLPKGETKVKQEGKDGKSRLTYHIVEKNGKQIEKEIVNEEEIEKPTKEIIIKGTKVVPAKGTGNLAWPTNGGYISSKMGQRWGRMHKGIDIARPSSYTIKAADHGVVVSAGWDGSGYGNKIVIDHRNGIRTVYAHLKSIHVKPGQTVERGSSIGVMGSTGNSTGVHLHFEVYKNGKLQNPLSYL